MNLCMRMRCFVAFVVAAVAACFDVAGAGRWIMAGGSGGSMPVFRKSFAVGDVAGGAVLRCTALGVYDVTVNGQRVEMGELNPGWTDYRHEVMCREIDVTPYLAKGENVIDIQLSNGWWNGEINRGAYGIETPLCVLADIAIDGKVVAATDSSWVYSVTGPLIKGDIYDGEIYDARNVPGDWRPVALYEGKAPAVIPHEGPLVKARGQELWHRPVDVTVYYGVVKTGSELGRINIIDKPKTGRRVKLKRAQTLLVDFGQNFAGITKLNVKGKRGTELYVRHGEMLNTDGDKTGRLDDGPAGSLWTYNLREADAMVRYTLAGDKKGETVRPRHTFMGFRYIEITATDDVEVWDVTGVPFGSDIREWGSFECSDPDINKLYSNTWWSQRSNFLSVPTDCPQRDERLGWTGDTQIFSRTAMYNSDAADFYRKWMRDMRNSQREDGAYPDIAPWCNFWGFGTAAWGDAGVIVPWNVYEFTGDTTIIRDNYESMTRWMDYLSAQTEEADSTTWRYIGGGTATGDWLAYEPLEPRYVSMAYYVYVAGLMERMASLMGREDDARRYAGLTDSIRDEFARRYVNADGTLRQTTQTAYLLALQHNLLPDSLRAGALADLCDKIRDNGYRLSTGFVGTPLLCTVLSDNGNDDLAYTLLQQRDNPSWLYSIDQGATTIWERWDSYTLDGGFHKHPWNMNSFNHYAYGSVVEWMYAYMCGIRPGAPGFDRILFAPRVDRRSDDLLSKTGQKRIEYATASTETPHGTVTSSWKLRDDGSYEYRFSLPEGLPYDIDIPSLSPRDKVVVTQK